MICGTIVLDSLAAPLTHRVAQRLYHDCRSGTVALAGFPDFQPLLSALKEDSSGGTMPEFQVTTQCGDKLVILEAFARKFKDAELTSQDAVVQIEQHNSTYNVGGEYWLEEKRRG